MAINRNAPNPPPWAAYQDQVRRTPRVVRQLVSPTGPAPAPAPMDAQWSYLQADFSQVAFTATFYLPADSNRIYLMIQNQGAGTLFADFSAGPTPNASGFAIAVGGFYEPFAAPRTAITFSGTGLVIVGVKSV